MIVGRWSLVVRRSQAARQPIQQLRVRRLRALKSQVAGSAHDAAAEVVFPDAVDDHAAGERVPFRGDPAGEAEAAAAGVPERPGRQLRRRWTQNREKARIDMVALDVRIAAHADVSLLRLWTDLRDAESRRERGGL